MRGGSRHRGEAGGGWLFGFPPLLATDGRIHKGDCEMTGAIFARGSCRALKWMALFGALLVLSAGEAVAQQSIVVSKASVSAAEGVAAADAPASQTFTVMLGAAITSDVTVTLTETAETNASLSYESGGSTVASLTFTAADWNTAQSIEGGITESCGSRREAGGVSFRVNNPRHPGWQRPGGRRHHPC